MPTDTLTHAEMLERHKRIVLHELYKFLRWDPTVRRILFLLSDGQISTAKAAEAITEVRMGIEPQLPTEDKIRRTYADQLLDDEIGGR